MAVKIKSEKRNGCENAISVGMPIAEKIRLSVKIQKVQICEMRMVACENPNLCKIRICQEI